MEQWILAGGLVTVVGLMLANNRNQDSKIDRNYKRLDEVKEYQDTTFTRKDMCLERHGEILRRFDCLESKLDKLLNGHK